MSHWHQQSYHAYLFDLDGTLVDTAPDINVALNHVLSEFGYANVSESLTRHWVGHGAAALIEEALKHSPSDPADGNQRDAMLEVFLDHYRSHITTLSRPYPNAVASIHALRDRGARTAVVTNKLERLAHAVLAGLEMTDLFDTVVGGDTCEHPKPHRAPVDLTLSRLSVAHEHALFVGDSTTDVNAARAAGVPVVVVRDGYSHGVPAEELGADGVIDTFAELVTTPHA